MKEKLNKDKVLSFIKSLFKNPLFYILLAMIVVDFATKWIVASHFNFKEQTEGIWIIPNFIKVTLKYNTGAIFGIGDGELWSRIVLIVIRLILAIAIPIVYFLKGRDIKKRYKVCLIMIYAGCIGNLIDGLFYWKNITGFDGVIDWIQFSFFNYIFNLADSFITVAVVLTIIFVIIDEIKDAVIRNRRGEYFLTPEEYEKKLAEENRKKNGYNNKK